ncbi:g5891 [Coccomyxa elongata]
MFGLSVLRPYTAEGKGLDGLSNPTQTKQGSYYGTVESTKPNLQSHISCYNGTTWCFANIPGRLDDLDLQQWQPPEDLLAQGSPPPSAEGPDDLLPTMSSLLEASDVSGTTAFPVNGAVEGAESPHFSFHGPTAAPFHDAESHIQLDSFSLDPLHPYGITEPAACHKDCAVDWCDLLDDIRMPLIPVAEQAYLQGWQVPLAAMGDTGYPVQCQPEKIPKSHFWCTLTPSSPCSANTSSQPGACLAAEWGHSNDAVPYSPVELPQAPVFFLAPERTGSTGSNDSSSVTYYTAAVTPAPAVPTLSGTPRLCNDAVTTIPTESRGARPPKSPASRRHAVRIRAGRSTLYPPQPAWATVPAAAAVGPSSARASARPAGPAAPIPASHMAPRTHAAAAASRRCAREPAGPAAPVAASNVAPRAPAAAAAGRRCARAPAGPTAWEPFTAAHMAPRIVTRGIVIAPWESAPARQRPVTTSAQTVSPPVTRVPAARLAATERNRKVQREYLQRKQAREQATHASVVHLEERLAELQAHMGPLLARHEQLTWSLPWHQQQEEVDFMASIARSSPCRTEASAGMQSPPSPSRFVENMMLEPDTTMHQIFASAGLHDFKQGDGANQSTNVAAAHACITPRNAARGSSDSAPLQSLVGRLRLTKSQKETIGEGYACYVQAETFLQEDCLALATKLQRLPTPGGALEDSSLQVLARHLIGSQLGGIIRRDQELTQRLTHTCFQVLNRHQVDLLRQVAPSAALDWPALCREITGGRLKRARPPPAADSIPTAQPTKRAALRASAVRRKGA